MLRGLSNLKPGQIFRFIGGVSDEIWVKNEDDCIGVVEIVEVIPFGDRCKIPGLKGTIPTVKVKAGYSCRRVSQPEHRWLMTTSKRIVVHAFNFKSYYESQWMGVNFVVELTKKELKDLAKRGKK